MFAKFPNQFLAKRLIANRNYRQNYTSASVYIGLNIIGKKSQWTQLTGASMSYSNWALG
jgi:hypothetical protein